jgi:sugar phosphate isomerase/epimerase
MKPLGLQLFTVRDYAEKDPVGTLKRVAEIGYKGVEGGGTYHGRGPKEYRKLLDDVGLAASSVWVPVPTRENRQEIVDMAATLGCTCLIAGRGPDEFKTVEAIRKMAAEFQAGAEVLKGTGLQFCVHNHWWEMDCVEGRLGEEILLEAAPDLRLELDIYWAANFGAVDVPALLAKYKKRTPMLHVKDGTLVKDEPLTAVGQGKNKIPEILGAADPAVLQWLVVEIDRVAGDMWKAVEDSYAYLTKGGFAAGAK